MFTKITGFIKLTLIGGIAVLLPVVIIVALIGWLFRFLVGLISPITYVLVNELGMHVLQANGLVIGSVVGLCFFSGVFIRLRIGIWFMHHLEKLILMKIPGYNLVKETVQQFLGAKKSPFSKVATVRLFGNETEMTAFVTDEHPDGRISVFVPTGPNPTSGNIYHLPKEDVAILDVPVDTVMRSIIGCGVGSNSVIHQKSKKSS